MLFRSGVQVLKKGIIWRVGSGQDINIWHDPWIPRDETREVQTRRGNQLLSRVADLIDPTTSSWDTQILHQTFSRKEASIIERIPIQEGAKDNVAWYFDKKGKFSVKSAYQVILNTKERMEDQGATSTMGEGSTNNIQWKKIWSLEIGRASWRERVLYTV